MFQYLLILMVMERPIISALKTPGMASATVGSGPPAASFDPNILPVWSFASKFSDFLSHFTGNLPFAIAVGSGSTAHSNGGGAVAVSDGEGATAAAVSNGGYAEAVAIGPGMECSATSNEGEIEIKRNEKLEDGTVKNDEFKHHY